MYKSVIARAADRSLCAAANFEELRRLRREVAVVGDGCRQGRTECSIPTARHVVNSIIHIQTVRSLLSGMGSGRACKQTNGRVTHTHTYTYTQGY